MFSVNFLCELNSWKFTPFRPHMVDVKEFTALWKDDNHEKVSSKSVDKLHIEDCVTALCQELRLHNVEVTGKCNHTNVLSFI